MYQSKENAGSIPWKSTRTGVGHGEGPRQPCVLEPTRSDCQFLRGNDRRTGKNEALHFRLRDGMKEKCREMRRDECARCGAYTPQTAATEMREETGWEVKDKRRKEEAET